MIRGLYTSASGMLAESVRSDVASNNLANVNTTGYKKDTTIMASFPEMLMLRVNDQKKGEVQVPVVGALGTGALVDEVITSHTQGQLKESSSAFDLAIAGDGYFTVEKAPGQQMYTRNGSFTIDGEGYLVTNQGYYVLGQAGRINIKGAGSAGDFAVDGYGNVTVNGERVDTLQLVSFGDPNQPAVRPQLTKVGESLFTATGQGVPAGGRVMQKYLETSNVNAITEMVDLITIMRSYEANQKAVQAHDKTLEQVINDVGRVK